MNWKATDTLLRLAIRSFLAATLVSGSAAASEFRYLPPGDLIPGSGSGRSDCTIYAPGIRFPLEEGPAFANSQVYNPGGLQGGSCATTVDEQQCCPSNYSQPWRDNYCEERSGNPNLTTCGPDAIGDHAGQDIRPASCADNSYWVVSASDGHVVRVPSDDATRQYVVVQASDGKLYSYLHLHPNSIQVRTGDPVSPGTQLGKVSNIDRFGNASTTYHLHFEVQAAVPGHGILAAPPYISLTQAYRELVGRMAPGVRIRALTSTSVHNTPGSAAVESKPSGATGTVLGNTTAADYGGHCWIWKQIQWDDGHIGYSQEVNLAVIAPYNLLQVNYSGAGIPIGGPTNAGTVALQGRVTTPEGQRVRLEVELRPRSDAFTGTPTQWSDYMPSGSLASVCASGLANGDYHWRARTRSLAGTQTPWLSYGGNPDSATDFNVQATVCAVCASPVNGGQTNNIQVTTAESCSTPLVVTLNATPSSGVAPLNDVTLEATVGGSASGTINYTFYCNRADSGTNITSGYAAKYDTTLVNPQTAPGACDYSAPGSYSAKVIVERGTQAAEARRTITVGSSGALAPEVSTLPATSVTQSSATLNATVHPKGTATTFWFDYGTTTSVTQSTSAQTLAPATSSSAVSISVGGLSCGQQYYFRVRGANAGGEAIPGDILPFSTDSCGGGGTQSVQLVADTSFEAGNNAWWVANPAFYINGKPEFPNPRTGNKYALLSLLNGARGNNLSGGMISPTITIPANATDADLRFWYSITSDETTSTQTYDKLDVYLVLPVNQPILVASLSNLDENGTSYNLESIDLSSSFYGKNVQIFFAGSTNSSLPTVFRIDDVTLDVDVAASTSPPTLSTDPADQLTASSARLFMTVNPNGAITEVWFDLEAGDSTPNNDTEHLTIGSGSQNEIVNISVFNLQCGTLYYFKANASNNNGSNSGTVRSFSTSACSNTPPRADTDPATNIGQTTATLNADVTANGLSTQAWFAWGTSTSLGQETPHVGVGSSTASSDFSQSISGLSCGTTYYFQNRASNSAGQDSGSILSFETLPCDGGGPSAQGFFLDSSRQGCSGGGPAVLLWWRAPAGIDNVFTVHRTDGAYTATVNSSQGGMAHLVSSLLVPGQTYGFYVEGTLNGATVQTNTVTVPVISDECRLPVGAGELPHLPLVWTGTPFCSGGTASVPLYWTAVVGANSYTLTRIDNVAGQLTPYPGLPGTSMVDSGLVPGAAYEYLLEAVGSGGSRPAVRISVFIPSGICGGEPSTPGPFSAQASTPVCDAGKGAVTLSWTPASGATSGTRTHWADDGFTNGSGRTFVGSSKIIDGIRPGALVKLMVQAEAAATPLQYRSVILAQRIPLDICGAGTLPPTVTTATATYVQERQALLRASVIPNADSSTAYFEWGTSPSFGSTTPPRNAGDGYRSAILGETLTGLACNTTYYFRVTAANAVGQSSGTTLELTTKPCTGLPVVTVTAPDPEASEQPLASGEFLIQRSGSTASDLTVTYSVGGTATVGQDHTLAGGSVVIPAGSSGKTLTVSPLDDQVAEADETVIVTLQGQAQYEVGQPSSAAVTIVSDEVTGGGRCGNVLVQQPRDEFGGCDASNAGIRQSVAENFRLNDRKRISCLEVLGYYWPDNDPPPASVFDVVIHGIASDGTPGAVVHEARGIRVQRQKTGTVSFGLEEWRFTIELPSPVELAAGDFFAEISGAAATGGSFCWIGGQRDPVAGLNGMAFRNTGPWSLGTWDLAFKVFEVKEEIFKDGFETGTTEKWDPQP